MIRWPGAGCGPNHVRSPWRRPCHRFRAPLLTLLLTPFLIVGCESSKPAPVASPAVVTATAPAEETTVPTSFVLSVEPWTFEAREGQVITTPSYRILTTTTRRTLAENIPTFMELALVHYTTTLGDLPRPTDRLETYLMANRPQWVRMTQRLMQDDAEIYLRIQRGGWTSGGRSMLYDIGPRDTFAIAAHEGWHQYTQKTFKEPLPTAIEEGLATYMEGFRWRSFDAGRPAFLPWANFERFEELRSAVREGRLMPLTKLIRSTPQELMGDDPDRALVYYAQVWALIHFLNEGDNGAYRNQFRRLISDAAKGGLISRIQREKGSRAAGLYASRRTGVDLLGLYTGFSSDDLDGPYQEFIETVVRNGSRQLIISGTSPVAPLPAPTK
jgi:hypothetical protein